MSNPMLVQYLVGLCCLRKDANAVDVIIGDMVLDQAAEKTRDVDITVTIKESEDRVSAFKAYEVKHEKSPLDVTVVESLCLKLLDMPSITHRGIVSSSGFTDGAIAKAKSHSVDLYLLESWKDPVEKDFPAFGLQGIPQEAMRFGQVLLTWVTPRLYLNAPSGPKTFNVAAEDKLFTKDGKPHYWSTFQLYKEEILLRSTEMLIPLEPAQSNLKPFLSDNPDKIQGKQWPYSHPIDVSQDGIYLPVGKPPALLESVTISGHLQWKYDKGEPEYYLIRRVSDGASLAGAIIAMGKREGQMYAITVGDARVAGVHIVQLEKKHMKAIRRLKVEIPR